MNDPAGSQAPFLTLPELCLFYDSLDACQATNVHSILLWFAVRKRWLSIIRSHFPKNPRSLVQGQRREMETPLAFPDHLDYIRAPLNRMRRRTKEATGGTILASYNRNCLPAAR